MHGARFPLPDKSQRQGGYAYLLIWSTKQSSTRCRHRYIVEVNHQPQAVSSYAWGKSYQYFVWVTNLHGSSSEVIMFIIIIIYIIISSLPILHFLPLHGSWSVQLFLRRPSFLLPVGVYSYTDLEMRVSFISNKCRVFLLPQSTVTLLILYTYSYSLTPSSVLRPYNVHHAADLSSSPPPSRFSHAVVLGSILTGTTIIWVNCSCISLLPALILHRMFQHTRLYII